MKKSELPNYCIVEFGNGERWLRIGTTNALVASDGWNTLDDYDDDLKYNDGVTLDEEFNKEYSIVRVWAVKGNYYKLTNPYPYMNLMQRFIDNTKEFDYSDWELVYERYDEEDDETTELYKLVNELSENMANLATRLISIEDKLKK